MKKFLATAMLLSILTGCTKDTTAEESVIEPVTITNTVALDSHYADMSPYKWIEGETAHFEEVTLAEANRLYLEGGSGIVYYGYIDCPWCQRAVPLLNEAAREMEVTVYYIDVYGAVQPSKEEYDTFINCIKDTLDIENGEYAFYVPYIAGVKNGKITGYHVSLLDSFTIENDDSQMDDAQKKELKTIYENIIKETAD